ncbi:transglycosylase domain-containing protein [Alkalilimnicola ehrlichii]|uniref:transglycosylase domain-containing protein n=1 Tax=Alkalilimnicola ehrlichii TaxID=351052 RepID=UPI002163D905|nr:transglycosylase domain-containing protein [Alkalilimnicola ehrlichii]
MAPKLPEVESLRDVKLQVPLRVYSQDGKLISEFGEQRRAPLRYEDIPTQMIQAFLAAEDERFFTHPGVDYQGLIRAVWHIVRTGEMGPGGSTITMQVARNFFLSREKTYLRKANEILLALKIDRELSKEEVLELYLNKIFLGHRAYGVGAAAQVYYGRSVDELTLAEVATIAGLPQAPSAANPVSNPRAALHAGGMCCVAC